MVEDARSADDGFRPDLEGLRGLAILAVLVFHAGIDGAGGGFVGVDVFFVLSGFLITGLLLRERERHGRIDLPAFYARRARRILPAALVVVVATLAASELLLAPLDVPRVAMDAAASALSVGNIRFAAASMDYFAAGQSPSPYLHYWSLGVEEQFYLVWPALLILVMRGRWPRLAAGFAIGVVLVASFAAAYRLTDVSAPWAFYSLPTRAWQLAVGGLLAVSVTWHARIPRWILLPVGFAGLAAIAAAVVLIGPETPYPGVAALLPTVGAAAVIVAGGRPWSVGSILRLPPARFLGRISYSLYLVHWPIFILAGAGLAVGESLPLWERLGLALLSVAVATVSYRLVEQPFRAGHALAMPTRRTLALAGAAVASALIFAVGVDASATRQLEAYASEPVGAAATTAPGVAAGQAPPGPAVQVPATASEGPGPTEAAAPPSSAPTTPSATAPPTTSPTDTPTQPTTPGPGTIPSPPPIPPLAATSAGAASGRLPPDVRPPLIDAAADWDRLLRDGCTAQELTTVPPDCVYGDKKGATTVALVGDSHAEQWFPALERIALSRDWRLVPFTKLSCRFVDMPTYSRILKRPYTECDTWRENVIARLQELKPDLVLVSVASGLAPMNAGDGDPRRQGLALARLLARIPGRIAIIADTPASDYEVPACLSRHVDDVAACATPRAHAFGWHHLTLEKAAAAASGATLVDLSSAICPGDPCPAVLDGMIVYRDSFHLTATFAAALAGDLLDALPELPPATLPSPATAPSAAPETVPTPSPSPGA